MPRDDSGPVSSASAAGPDGKAPLKRGDACLYCRKRRIRCSAEKPSCQHCTKLKRECVYDTGKPVSRVKQLEEKVAELEGFLKAGSGGSVMHALSQASGSTSATQAYTGREGRHPSNPPPLQHHSSSGTSTSSGMAVNNDNSSSSLPTMTTAPAGVYGLTGTSNVNNGYGNDLNQHPVPGQGAMSYESFAYSGSTFGPTLAPSQVFGAQGQDPTQYQQQQDMFASMGNMYGPTMGSSRVDPLAVEGFDFSTLDPSFMDLINSLGATSTGGMEDISQPQSQQRQQQQQSYGDSGMSGLSVGTGNGLGNGMDLDNAYSSGLTPFLDPTNGQGLGASAPPSSTTAPIMPTASTLSNLSASVSPSSNYSGSSTYTSGTGAAQPISIQPTPPGEKVSYHAFVTSITEQNEEATHDPPANDVAQNISPYVRENVIGVSSSANGSATRRATGAANGQPRPGDEDRMGKGWKSWIDEPGVPPELQDGDSKGLVGGWFDPTDLPRVARDHLLDLFFSGMRMFGQEFHIPRFFASRPHPCLLYSMYLMASRVSSSQPIRSLEKHFYDIAMEKLEESLVSADRLFDAVRAATILAVYKYSLAKYHEAWMMSGRASRLALSCGLHAIPTSVFRASQVPNDHRADLIGLMRQRAWVLPPPADAIALGERIWAFWAVYTVDRCGSIATQWPPSIPDDVITTPYPRPLAEYELGLVNEGDDVSVGTIYSPIPGKPLPPYAESTYVNLRMRTICILERASKLMYLKPEPGWQEALNNRSNSASSGASPGSAFGVGAGTSSTASPGWGDDMISNDQYINILGRQPSDSRTGTQEHKGWTRTASIRTPKAYGEVLMALRRIEDDMPPERRTNWEEWDGNVQDWHFGGTNRKEAFVLHFILGCSWMFLFDVFSFNTPNDKAVAVARRLAFTVRAVMNDQLGSDLDVFIAMTWSFVVKVIIREVKRLHAVGDHKAAAPLENEIEIIVQALQIFGKRYSIASFQAKRMDQFRKATAEDTKFMEDPSGDDGDEDHAQMPRNPPGAAATEGYVRG